MENKADLEYIRLDIEHTIRIFNEGGFFMTTMRRPIPVYATNGEPSALLVYPYLFNLQGEWIGWVTPERDVYSTLGLYVGYLTDEPRILRKRSIDFTYPRKQVPQPPPHIFPPATLPLAPMMKELTYDTVDVLGECPEDLHTDDSGELREDMD